MVQAPGKLAVVQTTVERKEDAEKLAALALEKGLAACIHVTSIESRYRWEGKVAADPEWRLDFKTLAAKTDALMTALAAAHPYDEPELIVIPVSEASEGYAAWVAAECTNPAENGS